MATTLIVGLGGSGINIVRNVAERAAREGLEDVEFVVMDTDVNDLSRIQRDNPNVRTIQTSPRGTVGAALDINEFARDSWFPLNDGVMGKSFSEGAGQVRSISRLALDHAIEQGMMRPLEEAIESLRGLSGEVNHQEMRVVVTGSLAGGTGSGILLPVGMYIRNFLNTRYQDNGAIIRGFFLEPDTFFDVIQEEDERNSLRCNAYAAVREVDAFFRKHHAGNEKRFSNIVFNAPQPGEGMRVDYPNILPYNFVFLMDAINEEGEHLPTKKDYEHHAADIIFAQTLSEVSSRASSKEDNVIKKLAASDGRARYCGGGVSFLEYPTGSIARYIALKWASSNLSEDWLELDQLYEQRVAENEDQKLADFFRATFAVKRKEGGRGLIASVGNETLHVYTKQPQGRKGARQEAPKEIVEEYYDYYMRNLDEFVSGWNEKDLLGNFSELQDLLASRVLNDLPVSEEVYNQRFVDEGEAAEQSYRNKFEQFFDALKKYAMLSSAVVYNLAHSAAVTLFSVSKYDDQNVFENRVKPYYVERIISQDGGKTAMHPVSVRYLLYSIMHELEEAKARCKSEIETDKTALEPVVGDRADFVLETADYRESVGEAVSYAFSKNEGKGGFKFTLPFVRTEEGLDGATLDDLTGLANMLNRAKRSADSLRKANVSLAFYDAVYDYVSHVSEVYEGFFKSLSFRIDDMSHETNELEKSREFNARRGKTHRYVCANAAAMRRIFAECPRKGSGAGLEPELCADIYRNATRIVASDRLGEDRHARANRRRRQFGAMFEDTIMSYWSAKVVDPTMGYPDRILKTVTQALIDEARYAHAGELMSPDEEHRMIDAHIRHAFAQARHIATPFIESPLASHVRNTTSCAYSPEITKHIGEYYDTVGQLLVESDGVRAEDYPIDQIMFYRSAYGFCADDLPKYAPAHIGHESREEGEYHRVYWRSISQLSPDLKKNRIVTPHVDKNWHLISFLPDLNEEHERQLRAQTVYAFIYGLVWSKFDDDIAADGTHSFFLKHERNRPRQELLVTDDTTCDQFYEVLDALKFNPCIVTELLDRFERDRTEELRRLAAPSVDQSELVNDIRSRAFARDYDFVTDAAELEGRIRLFVSTDTGIRLNGYEQLTEELVTRLFDDGADPHKGAISVFTIPLLYKISVRYGQDRGSEIEDMIETIFDFVRDYFSLFCEARNLADNCDRFYMEQYLRFERNVLWLEGYIKGINANVTVNSVRSLVESLFEKGSSRYKEVRDVIKDIQNAWRA